MTEKSAQNVKGFLLYDPHTHKHLFRVQHEGGGYTDYRLAGEDIAVTITDSAHSLYEDGKDNRVSWSSKYLGRGHDV